MNLWPCLGFVEAQESRVPVASGQSLQPSNGKASVSRPISFCFVRSLQKKALLPGASWAGRELIIATPFIIAIRRAPKCVYKNLSKAEASRIAAAVPGIRSPWLQAKACSPRTAKPLFRDVPRPIS